MLYSRDRRREGGFTLIEVLLVMVILVVLASFAMVAIGPIQRKVKLRQARTQIGILKTALQSYQLDMGMPPSTEQGLPALMAPPADLMNPTKWSGPYVESLPLDPWDQPYQYCSPGMRNPEGFDVWTVSPDGVELGNWIEGAGTGI